MSISWIPTRAILRVVLEPVEKVSMAHVSKTKHLKLSMTERVFCQWPMLEKILMDLSFLLQPYSYNGWLIE